MVAVPDGNSREINTLKQGCHQVEPGPIAFDVPSARNLTMSA